MAKEKELVNYDGLLVGQNIRDLRMKKGLSDYLYLRWAGTTN